MATADDVREAALALPATSERPAPRGGHPQFVTNGRAFVELPDGAGQVRWWTAGSWASAPLAVFDLDDIPAAWRLRAKRMDVAAVDYARGHAELAELFAELRTWPELTERSVGDFALGRRPFLHFHHAGTSRHADVRDGHHWGRPIPFPLGRPSADDTDRFLAEVRRRLAATIAVQ